jgi:hypothetical protein
MRPCLRANNERSHAVPVTLASPRDVHPALAAAIGYTIDFSSDLRSRPAHNLKKLIADT